jgi:hypothetical protein
MKKLVISLSLLAPGLRAADKQLTKSTTWDCKQDPNVKITNGNGKYTFKGQCKSIWIGSGKNKITIASVETLDVPGGSNKITIGAVDTISVDGSDNTITWKKARSGRAPTLKGQIDKNKISHAK